MSQRENFFFPTPETITTLVMAGVIFFGSFIINAVVVIVITLLASNASQVSGKLVPIMVLVGLTCLCLSALAFGKAAWEMLAILRAIYGKK